MEVSPRSCAFASATVLTFVDATTANIVFTLLPDFNQYSEEGIYRLFGAPETQDISTESGEPTGREAPRYVVKPLDFLSSTTNIIEENTVLIDFDQCFPSLQPPIDMLGTPIEYMAPEVAMGMKPSTASDVWALGCAIFCLRSGHTPFYGFEVTSPLDLMRRISRSLGMIPSQWQDPLR